MGYKPIHEHKRYYYTFDNSLLFTESIQNTTQIFPLNHNVGFFRIFSPRALAYYCPNATLQPVCIVLIIPGHSRSSPSGLWT